MDIYTYGYKSLKEVSQVVEENEIKNLEKTFDEMLEIMHKAKGIGLAANQIGITKRFFILDIDDVVRKIINPEILEKSSNSIEMEEGCLSIPGIYKSVRRPEKIKVKYLNEKGEEIIEDMDGLLSRAFQHELDHLDGVLFVEKISPVAKSLIRKKLEIMKKSPNKTREL